MSIDNPPELTRLTDDQVWQRALAEIPGIDLMIDCAKTERPADGLIYCRHDHWYGMSYFRGVSMKRSWMELHDLQSWPWSSDRVYEIVYHRLFAEMQPCDVPCPCTYPEVFEHIDSDPRGGYAAIAIEGRR